MLLNGGKVISLSASLFPFRSVSGTFVTLSRLLIQVGGLLLKASKRSQAVERLLTQSLLALFVVNLAGQSCAALARLHILQTSADRILSDPHKKTKEQSVLSNGNSSNPNPSRYGHRF